MSEQTVEVASGERFAFGANWARFLTRLNDDRITEAEKSLQQRLEVRDLTGKRFLDIGSGSGLFSLAARRLGAQVHSFDYDPQSVACTEALRQRYYPQDLPSLEAGRGEGYWQVETGSALDKNYLNQLGGFEVVYSWGVLHHTGAMWEALENVAPLVAPGGQLFIAIYNDQGWISRYWTLVKRGYNANAVLRLLIIAAHLPYLFGLRFLLRALTGRLKLDRGMSLWHDMLDWLGGYPFEVATPKQVENFYRERGFTLRWLKDCGRRHGCNEYVFAKTG